MDQKASLLVLSFYFAKLDRFKDLMFDEAPQICAAFDFVRLRLQQDKRSVSSVDLTNDC